MTSQYYIMNVNRIISQDVMDNNEAKPTIVKEKFIAYEEKSVGSTSFFKCEACPYMALAEDDIKFHLFTVHPDLAKNNGLADNIQIPCPGCNSVFDAEETLRTHLRNHHKMGIKDVRKMVKSLVQIALKNAKLKNEVKNTAPPTSITIRQELDDVKMPQVIEIVPDMTNNDLLSKGVTFISVDELQNMSTPNFEKVDPKEIIEEASINIVYTDDASSQFMNVADVSTSSTHNILQMSNVTPDLISSIQPRPPVLDSTNLNLTIPTETCEAIQQTLPQLPKQGRPLGSRTLGVTSYKKRNSNNKNDITEKFGELCSISACHVRLKCPEKLLYHRKCHQNGKLQCPECNAIFPCVEPLHTHLWKLHNVDMELPTCDTCGYKTYKRHRLYNIHMKKHGDVRAYPCTVCKKSFKNSNQLAKHRLIHKEDGRVTCESCQREFATDRRLRMHVAAVHEKLRPFKCSNCDFTAARKEELKLHLRSHTGDKPYACDHCSYRSSDHNSMRRHKKRHSKESLYRCKYCPYNCIQSTLFASHMISKHPDVTSNNIFRCPYCPYRSVNKDKYIGHLSTHTDKEGVQLLIEITKNPSKPSWTIPDDSNQDVIPNQSLPNISEQIKSNNETNCNESVNIPIELDDCDSQQESLNQNYCTNATNEDKIQVSYIRQNIVTNISKEDNNSDCLISESSNDTIMERQYPPQIQTINYENTQSSHHNFLNTSSSMEQTLLKCTNVTSLTSSSASLSCSNNIMSNFPIRLPSMPQISVRNNFTLKPLNRIPLSGTKITQSTKPTLILPIPSLSHSPVNMGIDEGVPRKKPKISVKSNLILKGPDQVNMFHSQQKMAFKQLEDNERFGLGDPVTFNNLITTQFMQLAPEPALSESPNNMIPFPQETMLDSSDTPIDNRISDNTQIFSFNQPLNVNSIMLPPQQKIQTTDPSYIKLEATIKQNTQSPSLERMCNANAMNTQAINREYKASPPLEDISRNMNEIKNEVKSDAFYNITLNNTATNTHMLDQYLMDNIIGEQYASHLDLSNGMLPEQTDQNDVIEIDDNSEDNKLLPRFDMNFPLESLYLMNNDFHFLDNEIPAQCSNSLPNDVAVNEMNRMVTEVPIINQNKANLNIGAPETSNKDFANFIQGKQDPMMNTTARLTTNKINVKNIELMKN